jgi:hypothetical protein
MIAYGEKRAKALIRESTSTTPRFTAGTVRCATGMSPVLLAPGTAVGGPAA